MSKQNSEIFQTNGSVFNQSCQTGRTKNNSVGADHKIRLMLGPENDKYDTQLYLKPRFDYNYQKNNSDRISAEFSADPIGYGDLRIFLMDLMQVEI